MDFIKEGFAKKFNHTKDLIEVYSPSVYTPERVSRINSEMPNHIKLLYPAMPYFYKNHRVIVDALKMINTDVSVLFTTNYIGQEFNDDRIDLIGIQPYERIHELYRECDALLFPSYIETFGLPLLEAAMTGMPIIASNLPYAHEVLDGYKGVTFVQYNSPNAWATAIETIEKGKRFMPLDISNRPGWKELFQSIQ